MMRFLILSLLLALAGCSTVYNEGTAAMEAKNYTVAEQKLIQAIQGGSVPAWNNLGVVYMRTGRREQAIRSFQMGARYGDPTSQQNLTSLGLPVPAADLKQSSGSAADGYAAALQGFMDGQNRRKSSATSSSGPVFCDSKPGLSPGSVSTTCY